MDAYEIQNMIEEVHRLRAALVAPVTAKEGFENALWSEVQRFRRNDNQETSLEVVRNIIVEIDRLRDMNNAYKRSILVDKIAELESQLCAAREEIRGMIAISDLWIPKATDEEHRGEAEALHSAREKLLAALSSSSVCRHAAEADALREGVAKLERVVRFLWQIIDDIDTVDDWAKGNDAAYRKTIRRIQAKRWETGISTDGYKLDLTKININKASEVPE